MILCYDGVAAVNSAKYRNVALLFDDSDESRTQNNDNNKRTACLHIKRKCLARP